MLQLCDLKNYKKYLPGRETNKKMLQLKLLKKVKSVKKSGKQPITGGLHILKEGKNE